MITILKYRKHSLCWLCLSLCLDDVVCSAYFLAIKISSLDSFFSPLKPLLYFADFLMSQFNTRTMVVRGGCRLFIEQQPQQPTPHLTTTPRLTWDPLPSRESTVCHMFWKIGKCVQYKLKLMMIATSPHRTCLTYFWSTSGAIWYRICSVLISDTERSSSPIKVHNGNFFIQTNFYKGDFFLQFFVFGYLQGTDSFFPTDHFMWGCFGCKTWAEKYCRQNRFWSWVIERRTFVTCWSQIGVRLLLH